MSEFVDRLAARADEEGLVDIAYTTVDTPLGTGLVAATPQGAGARRATQRAVEEVLARLAEDVSPRVLEFPARLDEARRELDEYFEGRRDRFELPLDWRLSHPGFYRRVLRATARVPFGEVITYGEAAQRAGNPRAFRAAGTALGSNPIPIVVPCHRVDPRRRRDRQLRRRPGDEALPAAAGGRPVSCGA